MSYATYEDYTSIYNSGLAEADFNRLSWDADRILDMATTTLDGVRKLMVAYPTDEYSSEAVRRCACVLVDIMRQLKEAEKTAAAASGYIETANGLHGKIISSVSAGNESVSFSASGIDVSTRIGKAVADNSERAQLLYDTVREYLSGATDANGISLIYTGSYPIRL